MKKLLLTSLVAFAALSLNAAEPSPKLKELRAERSQLRKAINKAVPDPNEHDSELVKLERASIDTTKSFEKALAEHSSLSELNAKLKAADARLLDAITKKDEAAKQAAQEEISALRHQRLDAAAKDPELEKLSKTAQEAGDAWRTHKDELLARLPQTKDLVKRMNEVTAEIAEELKKQRQ